MKRWISLLIVAGCAFSVEIARSQDSAQTSSSASTAQAAGREVDLKIPASQAWTDTGIDLYAGDLLQISATTPSGGSNPSASVCDPQGVANASSQTSNLPMTSASPGALIGKLHSQGAAPFLVGANRELKLEEAGHLYLAANTDVEPLCSGSFAVKVHLVSAQVAAQPAHAMPASEDRKSTRLNSSHRCK
jgi:hypothetical protein